MLPTAIRFKHRRENRQRWRNLLPLLRRRAAESERAQRIARLLNDPLTLPPPGLMREVNGQTILFSPKH